MSLFIRLVRDELGYCCVNGFLKAAEGYSARKVAEALGVNNRTVSYWRDKQMLKLIDPCPRCRHPQKPLVLLKTDAGRFYVDRCQPRSTSASSHKTSENSKEHQR